MSDPNPFDPTGAFAAMGMSPDASGLPSPIPISDPAAVTDESFLGLRIPSGDELYNSLMSKIEPELATEQLPLLDDRYKGETPDQSKARAHRYEEAFAEYDKQLRGYMSGLQQKLHAHQRIAMASAELGARAEEEDALSAIEANIQKS